MEKNQTTTVTYKEIICLAIKCIDHEIDDYEERAKGKGTEAEALVAEITKPLREKLEVLKSLYHIETGVEY